MNFVDNLWEHNMGSCSLGAQVVPSNNRLVIIQDVVNERVVTIGARYLNGRWINEENGVDVTATLNKTGLGIWTETSLFMPSSIPTFSNVPEENNDQKT